MDEKSIRTIAAAVVISIMLLVMYGVVELHFKYVNNVNNLYGQLFKRFDGFESNIKNLDNKIEILQQMLQEDNIDYEKQTDSH